MRRIRSGVRIHEMLAEWEGHFVPEEPQVFEGLLAEALSKGPASYRRGGPGPPNAVPFRHQVMKVRLLFILLLLLRCLRC